jgi:hypothetical protein
LLIILIIRACVSGNESFEFRDMQGIFEQAEAMLASQDGPRSVKLILYNSVMFLMKLGVSRAVFSTRCHVAP